MEPFLYFKSHLSEEYRDLSNFAEAPMRVEQAKMPVYASLLSPGLDLPSALDFPSSEHVCQALKAADTDTFLRFMTGGQFAALTPAIIQWLTKKSDWGKKSAEQFAQDKVKFYSRGGHIMVGAVAKYAGAMERGKRLGYALRDDREFLPRDVEAALWHEILLAKFTQNERARLVLLRTGTKRIVEHDKGARRSGSHWGGLVNEDGSVTGENRMGIFLERVRAELAVTMPLTPEQQHEEPAKKRTRSSSAGKASCKEGSSCSGGRALTERAVHAD
jgi:predicted NAD-dependent protein-ADP-ribosyltransferase YbiA (DUF1768 family)